jgi:hypothetical protein
VRVLGTSSAVLADPITIAEEIKTHEKHRRGWRDRFLVVAVARPFNADAAKRKPRLERVDGASRMVH